MVAVAGSMESVAINGRSFPVTADADSSRDLGGFKIEVLPNGDGSARKVKVRKAWMLEGITIEIDDDRGDQEFLQDVADNNGFVPIVATYASGVSYQGSGTVNDDLKTSSQSQSADVVLSGPGKLTKQ